MPAASRCLPGFPQLPDAGRFEARRASRWNGDRERSLVWRECFTTPFRAGQDAGFSGAFRVWKQPLVSGEPAKFSPFQAAIPAGGPARRAVPCRGGNGLLPNRGRFRRVGFWRGVRQRVGGRIGGRRRRSGTAPYRGTLDVDGRVWLRG